MDSAQPSRSATRRERLGYPVIDCDGHYLEVLPVLLDYADGVAGPAWADRFRSTYMDGGGRRSPGAHAVAQYFGTPVIPRERRERGDLAYPVWWALPAEARDLATATVPRLLDERLGEFGLDFTVLYPSFGLSFPHIEDDEARPVYCRIFNTYVAETFRPYAARMTPAAVVPMHTPDEAITELEYAVKVLGLKAVMIPTYVRRPIQALLADSPELAYNAGVLDTYGVDSDYDYDPFWQKCLELRVVPAVHSTSMGLGFRRSYTNFMHNHIGHFAAAAEGLCRSLVLGGVTRRFPLLRVAFLECGVSWVCSLYADMIGHWKKRNPKALAEHLNPATLDVDTFMGLMSNYGDTKVQANLDQIRPMYGRDQKRPPVDDFAALQIDRAEELRDLFVPHFYFGCEADDPMNAAAFNTTVNPYQARFRPVLSSDIGHWDVVDMQDVLEDAYELVEGALITEADLRDFLFTNPARMFGELNPDFFAGTSCESEVAKLLEEKE
jgi:predicted TIM-barrel fold metal-dependent hydrolase